MVICCLGGNVTEYPIIPIEAKDIIDTNGAGDSFVGGKKFIDLNPAFCLCSYSYGVRIQWLLP